MPIVHAKSAAHGAGVAAAHETYSNLKIHKTNPPHPTDKSHHLLAATFEIHAGESVPVHYSGPAVVYIIDGEFSSVDKASPGAVTKLTAGDVVHVEETSHLTWSSTSKGKAIAVTYAPTSLQVEDYVKA